MPTPRKSWLESIGDTLGEMKSLNPVEWVKGLHSTVTDPIGVVKAIGAAQEVPYREAEAAFKAGDYGQGLRHALAYLIPLLGPRLNEASNYMGGGEYAKGLGATFDVGAQVALPAVAGKVKSARVPSPLRNPNPEAAAAVQFGLEQGIPVDAATATGNRAIGALQHVADRSLGGSLIAERSDQARAAALTQTGNRLAERVSPTATTPELAAERVRTAVQQRMRDARTEANTAYSDLRAIEADPANAVPVATTVQGRLPGGGTLPITQTDTVAMPVDVTPTKIELRPVYDRLKRESDLVPLQGSKAKALTVLDRLMDGPDQIGLSAADAALSDLKGLARSDIPELRTVGQGIAAKAVQPLDDAVRTATAKAGSKASEALAKGREATKAKHAAGDVLKGMKDEPVRAYRQVTAPHDAGIERLRALAKQAPNEVPKLGRAYLDDLLTSATAEGGFDKAATVANRWQQLGPETKKLLYPDPKLVADLDKFFLVAKKSAANANPSGTAQTVLSAIQGGWLFTDPVTGIGTQIGLATVSKMLRSPRTVRLLTRGLQVKLGNRAAAGAVSAELATAVQDARAAMPVAPTTAGDERPSAMPLRTRTSERR